MTQTFRIELDRGAGWEKRGEAAFDGSETVERLISGLPLYARDGRAHRLLVDGKLVASITGRGKLTRHD